MASNLVVLALLGAHGAFAFVPLLPLTGPSLSTAFGSVSLRARSSDDDAHDDISEGVLADRRRILRSIPSAGLAAAASVLGVVSSSAQPSLAAVMPANPLGDSPSEFETGLLESRVTENVLSPPPYGLETPDIYYPAWFAGVWSVYSETAEVKAPCGPQLFGGNATLAAAKREIGPENALKYKSRFVPGSGGSIIADREYNVREIVKASMGANAVVDVSLATPNKLSCVLSPAGAGGLLSAELITLARRQETVDSSNFHCSEVVRQVVAPVSGAKPQTSVGAPQAGGARAPLLKEIETASLYSLVVGKDGTGSIRCRQRSATFLLPSQQDPIAYQLWQMSRGRPIDVRFYDVTYTKVVVV